jgi:hypothetical protein
MPATLSDPKTQLADAVTLARRYRHHLDCRCGNYRREGAPYCNSDEWRLSYQIDRLLDTIRRSSF